MRNSGQKHFLLTAAKLRFDEPGKRPGCRTTLFFFQLTLFQNFSFGTTTFKNAVLQGFSL
jgi:hypothetical protein